MKPTGKHIKGKRRAVTPTQRCLADARELGYHAGPETQVERRINRFIVRDWLGLADHILPHPSGHALALQVSADAHHAEHVGKALASPLLKPLLRSGLRFEVWSPGLRGARGERKTWQIRKTLFWLVDGGVFSADAT